jgi:hypothetical protein
MNITLWILQMVFGTCFVISGSGNSFILLGVSSAYKAPSM